MFLIVTVPSQIESIQTIRKTTQDFSEESLLITKNNNQETLNSPCEETVGNFTDICAQNRRGSCILLNENVFMNPQQDVKLFG